MRHDNMEAIYGFEGTLTGARVGTLDGLKVGLRVGFTAGDKVE